MQREVLRGAVLHCLEAMTLGMPFEVWKTRMGRFRSEGTFQSFSAIYASGGAAGFYAGLLPKLVESATKGAILMISKEGILRGLAAVGMSQTACAFFAGAGGGICQTVVMAPCTFLVTSMVGSPKGTSLLEAIRRYRLREMYAGSSAIAFRQATNWASRQGFTEFFRGRFARLERGETKTLSIASEVASGILGGALSTWNQPFEVARVAMQSAADKGPPLSLFATLRAIAREDGPSALFTGIVPRMGLCIWQTLFMVTGVKILDRWQVKEKQV
eukprot:Polyplicarium_translucidae@DN3299_c0_g2_i1.p1